MPADVAVRPPVQSHLLGGAGGGGGGGVMVPGAAAAAAALAWSAEEASGRLTLVGPQQGSPPQDVLARVYRTSLEHFAVLYPCCLRNGSRPLGVLNLRNTRVEPLEAPRRGFTVRQRAPDAPHALTFLCCNDDDSSSAAATTARLRIEAKSSSSSSVPSSTTVSLEDWLLAFTWRGSPTLHATPLPVVQEDEEV